MEVVDFRGQCHQKLQHCGCKCLELVKALLVISCFTVANDCEKLTLVPQRWNVATLAHSVEWV